MTHWKLPLALLLAIAEQANAVQIVDVREGDTALAKISRKEVTRIALERGRITKVTGNAGEFVLDKDDSKGQIFIRPADPQATKPINLFISSDDGTSALLLQPVDTPSDTIVIRDSDPRSTIRTHLESSGRHVRTCKNVLLALAQDVLPDDMEARDPHQSLVLWPNTRLTLERTLVGANVVGEKYQLMNTGTTEIAVSESELFRPGIMAVSLEHVHLNPGDATNLFVIRERGSHD